MSTPTTPAPARITPPFTLHTLHAAPTTTGTPARPAVALTTEDLDGDWLSADVLTPDQARLLAFQLVTAADHATSTTPPRFQAGDRVRVRHNGDTGVVRGREYDDQVAVVIRYNVAWFDDDDLEHDDEPDDGARA